MRSWTRPLVPELPGRGRALRVYDTLTGRVRPTAPGPTARLYVCGITPYDATHLGHAATYVAFDLLHRVWLDAGHAVHFVENVTDVDDPLLERAVATGQDWRALAERETQLFRQDMSALKVLPPQDYLGVIESLQVVEDLVETLRSQGAVYSVDGDLYFSAASDPRFGSVSGWEHTAMRRVFGERGGDPERSGKQHALDPLLWQAERDGDPAFPSTLGPGRPGWHVECTAIALSRLGMAFDVQGGGRDLVFPHHEMCASMAQVAHADWPFARAYVHTGMVSLDGEKMSKSRGNLVLVSDLRDAGHDPAAIRLALLAHRYREDWEWSAADLARAADRLRRWRSAVRAAAGPDAETLLTDVRRALADDLDAPTALRVVDRWSEDVAAGLGVDGSAPPLVARAVEALLGVSLGVSDALSPD